MPRLIFTLLYCILLICVFLNVSAQQKARNVEAEIGLLRNCLAKHHVQPRDINDSFSRDLFDQVIADLDPHKIYFTSADIKILEFFRNQLDDEVNGKATGFLTRLKEHYQEGLKRIERLTNVVIGSSLKWETSEVYDPEASRVQSEQELIDRHRQWMKDQILERLAELAQRGSVATPDFFSAYIARATAHVKLSALRPIKRLLDDPSRLDNEISNTFLKTMASVFDPHSGFLSISQYVDFVAALGTQDYHFGFVLGEDSKGRVIISALAPGGAAWKSGALHASDVLLTVKWKGEDPIDLQEMNLDDVDAVLAGNFSDELQITVRTADGNENLVLLRKEKIESEQNIVQSFVLEGPIKAGYIYLPDFYTRWDDEQEGGRCANDVAKEIIRLKKEGIEGLIMDLRFNGGGSLFEARSMAGIFIDEGPLALVTTSNKKAVTLKDMNRGTVYDGPLILLVNGQSASASEVLAASIQDYNRGLIVGSRTYGKATGQNLFPLEGDPNSLTTQKSNIGYVKLTTQRLYRLTGKSVQGVGVAPDVILPDAFSAIGQRERETAFALERDSVLTNPYFRPKSPLPRKELQIRSRERVAINPTFKELQTTVNWLEKEIARRSEPHTLDWSKYVDMIKDQRNPAPEPLKNTDKVFEVVNGLSTEQRLMVDEYARELYSRWSNTLASDPYLQETYNILNDFVALTKNPK